MDSCGRWLRWCFAWAVLATSGCEQGCDKEPASAPPTEPPRAVRSGPQRDASLAEFLGLDAGELPEPVPVDPPSPAGNLKEELDAFTTLDACVSARAQFDPVVGDAVDALGYDTLRRDACRVLQAVKTRDQRVCEPIVSSSLRSHCEASVAIVAGDGMMCPLALENHDALCMALARRDARLCSTVPRAKRLVCKATLARDESKCEGDARCERVVTRWKGLISDAAQGPELATRVVTAVTAPADAGEGAARVFDLSKDVGPATVRKGPLGTTIQIGEASTQGWPPAMVASDARLSLAMAATPATTTQGKHAIEGSTAAFVLLAPRLATLSSDGVEGPATLTVDLIGLEIGAPVRFTLEVKMRDDKGGYRVRLEVNTFVRDVVTVGR